MDCKSYFDKVKSSEPYIEMLTTLPAMFMSIRFLISPMSKANRWLAVLIVIMSSMKIALKSYFMLEDLGACKTETTTENTEEQTEL